MRPLLTIEGAYPAVTIEKVERLLEVLAALRDDPLLRDAFVLHGGTALNVFADDVPRLSVDLDLMFVAERDVDAMRAVRRGIDARLREVISKLGYVVRGGADEHSGQTYRLRYGAEYVKIDVTYLSRITLLDPVERGCPLCAPPVTFPVLDERELLAGKVKALMERVASRDLFDLARLAERNPGVLDDLLVRRLVLRAVSAADTFPGLSSPVAALDRFADPASDLVESLAIVLPAQQQPDLVEMRQRVETFLLPCSTLDADEAEYFRLLAEESTYRPSLLLADWPDILARAEADPVMEWKVQNLRKRLEVT